MQARGVNEASCSQAEVTIVVVVVVFKLAIEHPFFGLKLISLEHKRRDHNHQAKFTFIEIQSWDSVGTLNVVADQHLSSMKTIQASIELQKPV